MAKSYTEKEASTIFVAALIIGTVVTSIFWAIFVGFGNPVLKEINSTNLTSLEIVAPQDFINFCNAVDGTSVWDSSGFRQCSVEKPSDKNLITMNLMVEKW